MSFRFLYFLIPTIIFCAFSSSIQFGSTIKLFCISLLIFASLLIPTNNTSAKQFQKLASIILLTVAVYPILLSLIVTQSTNYINLLNYSNVVFLIFIFITFQADYLKTILYSFALSLIFLLPLAYLLKDNQIYGDPVGNSNILGQMICVGLISSIYLLLYENKMQNSYFFFSIPIIFSLYFLFVIKSRGSFIFLIIAISFIILITLIKKKSLHTSRKFWVSSFVALFILFAISLIIFKNLNWNLFPNMAYRKNLWEAGLKIFYDNWFIGIGNGNLPSILPSYWDTSTNILSGAGETEYHIHNEFLNISIHEGIFSLLLFCSLILLAFINGIKYYFFSTNKKANLVLPFLAIFLGVCFQISVDRILHFPATGLLFAFVCGVLLSLSENLHVKPIKIPKYLILSLALIYSILTWPFMAQQYLYVKTQALPQSSMKKFESLKEKMSAVNNEKDFRKLIKENIKEYPISELKQLIEKTIARETPFTSHQFNSIFLMIIDLELNWSRNYKLIINSTDFPDLKVMSYKKYVNLLIDEGRSEEAFSISLKANQEFPLIMKFTYYIYLQLCEQKEYQKALDYLLKASKISSDPYLIKKIIFHRLIFENKLDYDNMKECIRIRHEIEYNPQYAKKNVTNRFGTLDSYYVGFIYELLSIKESEKAYEIILQYVTDDNLRKLPSFKEFITNIKVAYPDIYQKLKQEPFLNI